MEKHLAPINGMTVNAIEIPTTTEQSCGALRVKTEHKLRIAGADQSSMSRWGIGAVPRGQSARQVDGGPLVPGPWAYLFQLASVIDNYGGSGAESARERAAGLQHDAKPGDVVRIDGNEYTIHVCSRGYASLVQS
jgi:hypothetical protein